MKRKSVLFLLLMAMFMPLAMHAQKALPYEYGFENNDLSGEGWTTSNTVSNSAIMNLYNSGPHYYVYGFAYSTNPPQYLISPELTGTENGVNVEFEYAIYNTTYGNETFQVGYSTTTNATDSFTWATEVTASNAIAEGGSWLTYSKNFPAGTKYVAVKHTSYDALYLFVDNFSFTAPDLCGTPSNLVSSDVTTNAATLSWEGLQDSYNVRYRTAESIEFFEDFNEGIPSTWTTIDNDGDGNNWTTGQVGGMDDTYCATSASYSSSALTPDNWLCTPQIALDGTMKVWMRAQDPSWPEEHFAIYATTASEPTVRNFTSGTTLVAETVATGEYVEYTADLSSFNGQLGYIAIRHFNCTDMFRLNVDNFGLYGATYPAGAWVSAPGPINRPTTTINGLAEGTDYEWQVQGICSQGATDWSSIAYFHTASACDTPVNLLASDITANSAVLNWSDYQDNYNLRYRHSVAADPNTPATVILTAGDVWGDGSGYQMVLDADATAYSTVYNTTDGWLISDWNDFEYLIPENADYDVNSTNVVFNNSVTIQIPAGTYDWFITNPSEGVMYIAGSGGDVPGRYDDFVFEPGVTYEFTMQMIDNGDGISLTITHLMGDWTSVNSISNPYDFTNLIPDTEYEWQVQGICSSGNTDWSEIASFVTLPSCIVPTNLAVSNVTADGADLKWTSDATSFEIELNDGSNVVVIDGVTETRYMLLDLEPATIYNVRVRANCGGGDYSQWTNPVAFVTDCGGAKDLPYSYGFEDIGEYYACWYAESYNDENEVSIYWEDEEHTNRVFAFSSFYDADDYTQVLISPELNATTPVSFQFDYKVSSQYAYESVLVGYITDEMDNFEWLYDIYETNNYDEWETFSGIFPAGTKYVALYYFSEWQYYLFIDNFRFDIPKTFVTDGDWDEANNWSPAGVPTSLDNVAIEAEATIPADCVAEVNAILIEEGGSITIEDGGLLYHSTDELEVTVKKNVPAYTGDNDYKLISFPFYGTTVPQDMTTPDGYDLYRFDNSQPGEEWQNNKQLENEDIYMDEGYLYANPEGVELSVTGNTKPSNEYYGSDLNYEYIYLSYDDTENEVNGWYLLGNPFLVDAYIYSVIFGEDENGDYTIEDIIPMNAMYYDENGDMQTIEGGPIAPMQGFFVSVTEDVEAYIFPFDFLNAKNKPSLKSLKKRNGNNNTIPAVKLPNIAVKSVNTMPATMTVKPMPVKTKAVKSEPAKTMSVKSVKAAPANTVSKKTMSITPMLDKKLSTKK